MHRRALIGQLLRSARQAATTPEGKPLTQAALAKQLEVSPSLIALIEKGERSLAPDLARRIEQFLGLSRTKLSLSAASERTISLLEEMARDKVVARSGSRLDVNELERFCGAYPRLADTISRLFQAYREELRRRQQLEDGGASTIQPAEPLSPARQVNEFLQQQRNHFPDLEHHAQQLCQDAHLSLGDIAHGLRSYFEAKHRLSIKFEGIDQLEHHRWKLDRERSLLRFSLELPASSRAFHFAQVAALLEHMELLRSAAEGAEELECHESRELGIQALAKYFAGAVVMPYETFLNDAVSWRYDIERLRVKYDSSFEQVCHRLTTLREGVQWHFLRIDTAGKISKSFSANSIRFPDYADLCSRCAALSALAVPHQLYRQVSRMYDEDKGSRDYFCFARSVAKRVGRHNERRVRYAIGMGCELQQAKERAIVYADGLDLNDDKAFVHVGRSCNSCGWKQCPQRIEPEAHHSPEADANASSRYPHD